MTSLFALHCGHHNSNGTYIKDGQIVFYTESERISKQKYDCDPRPIISHLANYTQHVEEVLVTHCKDENIILQYMAQAGVTCDRIAKKNSIHHMCHAASGFFSSEFKKATVLVCDGRGSTFTTSDGAKLYETTSAYELCEGKQTRTLFKRFTEDKKAGTYHRTPNKDVSYEFEVHAEIDTGGMYQAVAKNQGFSPLECGKTMGLAAYGKPNHDLPSFLEADGLVNANVFLNDNSLNVDRYPILAAPLNSPIQADISYAVQKAAETMAVDKIRKVQSLGKTKNLVLSGGVFQNVLVNSKIRSEFPHLNVHVDPFPTDGGLSLGAALWRMAENGHIIRTESTYLGKNYEIGNLPASQCKQVANLLAQGKIGALYQGRSESGCRALGNRSLLFNPTLKDGKELINKIKKREWFRPFAATVIEEYASDWFSGGPSPFMTYAIECKKPKWIPSVIHEDNTCRVQTLQKNLNPIFWEIIEQFRENTGIPVIGNTSFNVNGQPIVETREDALEAFMSMELDFIYLADEDILLT